MKVHLYGKYGQFPQEIKTLVDKSNLEIDDQNPEVVITFGGDGTLLGSERDYPSIPKLPLRSSELCYHCFALPNEKLLELLSQDKLQVQKYPKLQAKFKDKILLALSDVSIRNLNPTSALRFHITSNQPLATSNLDLIGDGLVLATPFGSSGYFFSITRQTFSEGLGLAFNNIHNINAQHQVLPASSTVNITISRGPGTLTTDNSPNVINLEDQDKITISYSPQTAQILTPTQ